MCYSTHMKVKEYQKASITTTHFWINHRLHQISHLVLTDGSPTVFWLCQWKNNESPKLFEVHMNSRMERIRKLT